MATSTTARMIPADATTSRWTAGDTYRVAVDPSITGAELSLIDAHIPPGGGPAPHVHKHSDETYFMIAGHLEVLLGEETFLARTGDTVWIPRGTPHRFLNVGITPAHLLFAFTPAGPEQFFLLAGNEPQAGVQAPLWGPEHYTEELVELLARYDNHPVLG